MQSRVLSGSGDSGPGLVGVPAAAAVAAAAATVGDYAERGESIRSTVERANSPSNRTFTPPKQRDLTLLHIGLL